MLTYISSTLMAEARDWKFEPSTANLGTARPLSPQTNESMNEWMNEWRKKDQPTSSWAWWYTPVILATGEVYTGRMKSQHGNLVRLFQNNMGWTCSLLEKHLSRKSKTLGSIPKKGQGKGPHTTYMMKCQRLLTATMALLDRQTFIFIIFNLQNYITLLNSGKLRQKKG